MGKQRILIAEDNAMSLRLMQAAMARLPYELVTANNGIDAVKILTSPTPPRIALLDWSMPGLDGVEVCRLVRVKQTSYIYMILVTARSEKTDIVDGLGAGADDFVSKPVDFAELSSRIAVGQRIVDLEIKLEAKVSEVEAALKHVQQLQGLLPICMDCKKIRDDGATWHKLEAYIEGHSEVEFSHALCDECGDKRYGTSSHA